MEFFDIGKLTIKDLDEIQNLQKALSLSPTQALYKWMRENPGKVDHVGSMDKEGNFEKNEIDDNGIKEYKDGEGIIRMINQVLKNKKEK